MSTPDISTILEDLAAGRIDAAEAGRRIAGAKSESESDSASGEPAESGHTVDHGRPQYATYATDDLRAGEDSTDDASTTEHASDSGRTDSDGVDPDGDAAPEKVSPSTPLKVAPAKAIVNGVERVSVRAVGRRVRVAGDSAISTVTVEGPHVLRRNGSVMEVSSDGDVGPSLDGFSMLKPPRNFDDLRAMGLGKELVVRVNPKLIVDIEVTAGSLRTDNVHYLGKIRVTAGSAKLNDVSEVTDALIQAGSATVNAEIVGGRSRIRCESGSLSIHLDDRSNVTVKTETQLGRVSWSGGHTGASDEVVMGNGNARLDVDVVMGHAQVRVGSETEESE